MITLDDKRAKRTGPVGLMWVDAREGLTLKQKISAAITRFENKFGRGATCVQVNADDARKAGWTPAMEGEAVTTIGGVPVIVDGAALSNHVLVT